MKHPFFVGQVLSNGCTIVAIDNYNVPNGDLANSKFSILYLYKQGEGIRKITISLSNMCEVEDIGIMPTLRAELLHPKQSITYNTLVQGAVGLGGAPYIYVRANQINKVLQTI